MDITLDLTLSSYLKPQRYGHEYSNYDDGALDFLALLRMIEREPAFDLGWFYAGFSLWDQVEEYLQNSKQMSEENGWPDEMGAIHIIDNSTKTLNSDKVFYSFDYNWGMTSALNGDISRPNPKRGLRLDDLIGLVDVVTKWKPPQHLAFGPTGYLMDHHPLDRRRMGIRWIGWIPFQLLPADVPEAEIVRPMNGGTIIVTQSRFWQVGERHPDYSSDAIRRTQNVELRLNSLGVLPTGAELQSGDWGEKE